MGKKLICKEFPATFHIETCASYSVKSQRKENVEKDFGSVCGVWYVCVVGVCGVCVCVCVWFVCGRCVWCACCVCDVCVVGVWCACCV